MELNAKESSVYFDCLNKISFVQSVFSQEGDYTLSDRDKSGLIVILGEVLHELDAIEDGKYCDPQTAEAVSEERTLAVSEAAHQNEQAEAQGVQ